jgi:predicted small secreted protein
MVLGTQNSVLGKVIKSTMVKYGNKAGIFYKFRNHLNNIHMKKLIYMALFLTTIIIAGCQRNYYSGTGKGSNCGCPSKKGMVGY